MKVLIVTYYFPPSGGAGVQRALKFVKYLREFGWEPVVLTAHDADYPAVDESLALQIPKGTPIYRAKIVEPYRWYRKFTGRPAGEATDIATLSLDERQKTKISERLAEWVRAALFVPDARIGWLPFAVRMGRKILAREHIDVIFSTAPPYTTHLIGLHLHRAGKIPWVADFRDSWIGWLSAPQWRPALSRLIERRMERAVLREADQLIAVSRGVQDDLLSRHPQHRDQRWEWLPNGFDAQDFSVTPKPRSGKMTITYTGSLYGHRNPEYLLRALENILCDRPEIAQKILVRLVGRVADSIQKRIAHSPAANLFEIIPYVPHHESLAYLLAGDISLLIIDDAPENKGILTGKLFEYIGAGHPIFALAPEGEAADLIRTHQLGVVAPPKDTTMIAAELLALLETLHHPQSKSVPRPVIEKFERRELTRQLAAIFDRVT